MYITFFGNAVKTNLNWQHFENTMLSWLDFFLSSSSCYVDIPSLFRWLSFWQSIFVFLFGSSTRHNFDWTLRKSATKPHLLFWRFFSSLLLTCTLSYKESIVLEFTPWIKPYRKRLFIYFFQKKKCRLF